MCDEISALSLLHQKLQDKTHRVHQKMNVRSCPVLSQNSPPKEQNDLLQFHIDLCLISTDKDEKIKKLEKMRKNIDYSRSLFLKILNLQQNLDQDDILDVEVVGSVLDRDNENSRDTEMYQNVAVRDIHIILERLKIAKARLFSIAKKEGLELQSEEMHIESNEMNERLVKQMEEELQLIEKSLEEKRRSMEVLQISIAEKTIERNNLKEEIEKLKSVNIEKTFYHLYEIKNQWKEALKAKKNSLRSQIVVQYDLSNYIQCKTAVAWDGESSKVFNVFQELSTVKK